jgi:hypothetical protein
MHGHRFGAVEPIGTDHAIDRGACALGRESDVGDGGNDSRGHADRHELRRRRDGGRERQRRHGQQRDGRGATSITATFTVAAGATTGTRSVTVTTTGGTTGAQTFTVNAAPVATATPTITALRQPDGATSTSLAQVITGTNFGSDATVAVSGSGVTASNVTVAGATSITATFAVAADAAVGARTVTVTSGGVASNAVTFTVTAPSQVTCLPSTQTIQPGGTATFQAANGFGGFAWSAPGGSPASSGDAATFSTTYAAAGTYTVTVTRGTTATCAVVVQSAIGIDRFQATPDTILGGGSTTLSWSGVRNATSCVIDHGIGAVACSNANVPVNPIATTTYTFTASGVGGTATATTTVTVTPGPSIAAFSSNAATINVGQSSTLSWSGVTNATSCAIDHSVGTVSCASGSTSVTPAVTTTYTLTATQASVNATRAATVTVIQVPTIGTFTANPGSVSVGDPITLAWTGITSATSCTIDVTNGGSTISSFGVSCADGNTNYTATTTGPTTFTLKAVDSAGTATKTANVTVS